MSPKCVANVIDKKSVFPIEVKCEKFTIYSVWLTYFTISMVKNEKLVFRTPLPKKNVKISLF